MVKNLGFWLLFGIYLLGLIADITTTFMVRNREVLESNPVYHTIGFTGIILINLFVAWLLWWLYSRPSATPATRFILLMSMLMIVAVRVYAVQNAWYFITNPVTLQEAVLIATPQALAATTQRVVQIAYPPFIMGIIGYCIWRIDHYARRKDIS